MNFWRVRRCVVASTGLAVLLAGSLVFAPGARAQNPDNMRVMLDRMQRLERDIRTLNLQLSRGTPPPVLAPVQPPSAGAASGTEGIDASSPALARLNVRLSALEGDLRSATGAMEDLGFQLGQFRQRLDQLVSDVDYRLGVLEGRGPGASQAGPAKKPRPPRLSAAPSPPPVQKIIPGQQGDVFAAPPSNLGTVSQTAVATIKAPTGAPPASSLAAKLAPQSAPKSAALAPPPTAQPALASTPSVLPKGTSKEQYNYAFGLLRQANYDKAELALQEFVRLHPKEALASNARYWLGETYYVRSAFVQAADVFLEGYKADPKGPKASDSLLKLGMSLGGLDKKREACATFDKLIKDFPDISAGVKSTVKREKQKNGCS